MRNKTCLIHSVTLVAITTMVSAVAVAQSSWPGTKELSAADMGEPQVNFIESVRNDALVSAVDKSARAVTLLYPDGSSKVVAVGDEVRNFEQIQVGDTVITERHLMTKILMRTPQSGATASERSSITRSAPGEKPGGTAVITVEEAAVIESVDLGARTLTLRGSDGRSRTITIPASAHGLEDLKTGNTVTIQQTDAVVIGVSK